MLPFIWNIRVSKYRGLHSVLDVPVHLDVATQSLLFLLGVPLDLEYLGPDQSALMQPLSPVRVLSALPP